MQHAHAYVCAHGYAHVRTPVRICVCTHANTHVHACVYAHVVTQAAATLLERQRAAGAADLDELRASLLRYVRRYQLLRSFRRIAFRNTAITDF